MEIEETIKAAIIYIE